MAGDKHDAPIFLLTHPRSRSTAFERMFLTRPDCVHCIHEIFQFPFYVGPERLNRRSLEELKAGLEDGHDHATYKWAFDEIEALKSNGERVFIKDMAKMFVPPQQQPAYIVPSLSHVKQTDSDIVRNPTCIPSELLRQFHFTFLIRDPYASMPSLYRLCQPPLSEHTGWHGFREEDVGLFELRTMFDYLRDIGAIGPTIAGTRANINGSKSQNRSLRRTKICVIDSDELERDPHGTMETYCKEVGVQFQPEMLYWGSDEDKERAMEYFKHCRGFHLDLMKSTKFQTRPLRKRKSDHEIFEDWCAEFGVEGATAIHQAVHANLPHYLHMKQFCMEV